MPANFPHELLDFGNGRKLERFGHRILDRPAPQAAGRRPRAPRLWATASARFTAARAGVRGTWAVNDSAEATWQLPCDALRFQLRLADQGQVGVFPEQVANWCWIQEQLSGRTEPLHVLNLFAYTGGSTLAAAISGAAVTHVDAAASAVAWARENARLSGLETAPIRWLTEDATKLVRRELRRGRQYQGIILDPPSFGRGPRGEVWKLTQHLPELLQDCGELGGDQLRFILLTCHTTGVDAEGLLRMARDALQCVGGLRWTREELVLSSRAGGCLPSGWAIRGIQSGEK